MEPINNSFNENSSKKIIIISDSNMKTRGGGSKSISSVDPNSVRKIIVTKTDQKYKTFFKFNFN